MIQLHLFNVEPLKVGDKVRRRSNPDSWATTAEDRWYVMSSNGDRPWLDHRGCVGTIRSIRVGERTGIVFATVSWPGFRIEQGMTTPSPVKMLHGILALERA